MNTTKLVCFGMVGKLFAASVKIEGLIYDWVKLDSTIANACCFVANEFRAKLFKIYVITSSIKCITIHNNLNACFIISIPIDNKRNQG
jgi:hypothetical protein